MRKMMACMLGAGAGWNEAVQTANRAGGNAALSA